MELETPTNKPFEAEPIGFEKKIDYAYLYSMLVYKLNELHGEGRHDDAITHFSMMIPTFGGLFDRIFINNCKKIEYMCDGDSSKSYMLQKVELARLMTRAGIAPKPDIRLRYIANWNVPKTIEDLSFDGKKGNTERTESLKAIVAEVLDGNE